MSYFLPLSLGQVCGKGVDFDLQFFGFSSDDSAGAGEEADETPPAGPQGTVGAGGASPAQDDFTKMVQEFVDDGQPLDGTALPHGVRSGIQKVLEAASPYRKLAKELNISDPGELKRMVTAYQTLSQMSAEQVLARLANSIGPQAAIQHIAETYGLSPGAAGTGKGQVQGGQADQPVDYMQAVEEALGAEAEYLDDITKKSLAAAMKAVAETTTRQLTEKFEQRLAKYDDHINNARQEQLLSSVRTAAERVLEKNKEKIPANITADQVMRTAIRIGVDPSDPKQMELALLACVGEQHTSILDATFSLAQSQQTARTQERVLKNIESTSPNILRSGAGAQKATPDGKKSWKQISNEIASSLDQKYGM